VIDCFASGLPDGIFAKKYQCGYILEKLAMETFSIFDDFWVVFLPVGTFCGYLVYFFPFWYIVREKSGNPALDSSHMLSSNKG
jgi:hypothetical protein